MRFLLLLIVFFAVDSAVLPLATHTGVVGGLLFGLAGAALALILYRFLVGRFEHRPATEVARHDRGLRNGVLIGIGMVTATMALIAFFDGYRPDGWGSVGGLLAALGIMAAAAVIEEILFRAVLFRYVEGWTNTWIALAVSAVVFGGLHLLNPDATVVGALSVTAAGTMLAAAYVRTRNLWLPIGLHFGWNFAESGIFGATVSGSGEGRGGLLRSSFDGPAWLTGGAFGPEASVPAILVCGIAVWLLLRRRSTVDAPVDQGQRR